MIWSFLLACQPGTSDEALNGAGVGDEAPDFTVDGAGDVPVTLSDDRGKVILLDMSGLF